MDGAVDSWGAARLAALIAVGRRVAVASGAALLTVHLLNFLIGGGDRVLMIDANAEGAVWSWASVVVTASVALGAFLGAVVDEGRRAAFVVVMVISLYLSIDDLHALHERFSVAIVDVLGVSDSWDSVIWPVLFLPMFAVLTVLLLKIGKAGTKEAYNSILLGIGLLVFAVAIEVVSAPWSVGLDDPVHVISGGVEEACEMTGWILISVGVLAAVLARFLRLSRDRVIG